MAKYTNNKGKSISFGADFNLTFAEFKKQYEDSHIFRDYPPKEREVEMKKAHALASKKDSSTQVEEAK